MLPRNVMISDLEIINSLIRESKGFWGYSDAFLDDFMKQWGVKETYIHSNDLILFGKGEGLIGLYAFKINDDEAPELDLFFINRKQIGQGIGKIMWQHALDHALKHHWTEFKIIADPNAEPFYKRMGATTIGTFESFPGRFVPVMKMKLNIEAEL
ncbi:GNAT family N-acetyltransferase [Legionella maioricensis]|uniref:GNAT family N-acetyltransferase n=1 Tax=Legionella maioricensis TaxID=2896528 RepID=A0A9X2D2J1_9GAMM|nr:GNAT family N-acetyltransferase [Legionella maioricensis]MCL9685053.1 GNAT family N-acetyltransferase [Legionella maioricensis]MCL9688186.1 GNAT family N-acetyltransferase [Legionella maioricensis]